MLFPEKNQTIQSNAVKHYRHELRAFNAGEGKSSEQGLSVSSMNGAFFSGKSGGIFFKGENILSCFFWHRQG